MTDDRATYSGLVGVGELGEGSFKQGLCMGEGAFLFFDGEKELVGGSRDEYFFAVEHAGTNEIATLERAQERVSIFFEMT